MNGLEEVGCLLRPFAGAGFVCVVLSLGGGVLAPLGLGVIPFVYLVWVPFAFFMRKQSPSRPMVVISAAVGAAAGLGLGLFGAVFGESSLADISIFMAIASTSSTLSSLFAFKIPFRLVLLPCAVGGPVVYCLAVWSALTPP